MKKLKSTANNIQIQLPYFLWPLLFSSILTFVFTAIIYFQKNTIDTMLEICNLFFNIGATFSLTFIAFSITALALLQLLQTKEWFVEVSKSVYFKRFLKRFLYSAKFCLFLFLIVILFNILKNYQVMVICYITLIIFFLIILYIVFWVWSCISDFIELFK